jgi:hypothetical protein
VVGGREFGVERNGLVEVRNRTVTVTLGQEGIAAVEKAKPAAEGINVLVAKAFVKSAIVRSNSDLFLFRSSHQLP